MSTATPPSVKARDVEDLFGSIQYEQITRLLIHTFSGCLPDEAVIPHHCRRILDLGCGPGTWAFEYARSKLACQVVALDTQRVMIEQAKLDACQCGLGNVEYRQITDLAGPFTFPDNSFSLIHLQQPVLPFGSWSRLLAECWRLLRPHGKLCIVLWEEPLTNAPSWELIAQHSLRALSLAGRSFSFSSERHQGLLCTIAPRCIWAGFHVTTHLHTINFSFGAPDAEEWQRALVLRRTMRNLIIKLGVTAQDDIDALYGQQLREMRIPTFQGMLPMMVLWATKQS